MANNDKENKIKKFTKEAIGKTLNQFNKEIGIADLVEINKNQDRILNGILSQVNDENTEKTEKSNIITLDNSTDGIVELKEIQGDTNVNVSKIEEMPITHDIGDKEGNVFTLNEIPKGAISIGEIQGNTMVNCNKDDKKELVLMKDLSTQGDNNITLTEGVDGGKVDVALEGNTLVNVSHTKDDYITHEREEDTTGNHIALADEGYIRPVLNGKTMVNVCDRKDPIAVTKSYVVENSGNHVVLQGEYDGKCRPVVTGNTLVNGVIRTGDIEVSTSSNTGELYGTMYTVKPNTTYTISYFIKASNSFTVSSVARLGMFRVDETFSDNTQNSTHCFIGDLTTEYQQVVTTFTTSNVTDKTLNGLIVRLRNAYTDSAFGLESNTLTVKDVIILEGDYTDRPIPDYFEGLQSSFEDRVVPENIDCITNRYIYNNMGYIAFKTNNLVVGKTYTLYVNNAPTRYGLYSPDGNTPLVSYTTNKLNTFTYTTSYNSVTMHINDGGTTVISQDMIDNMIIYLVEGDYTRYDFSDYDPTKVGKYRVDYKATGKNKFHGKSLLSDYTINNDGIIQHISNEDSRAWHYNNSQYFVSLPSGSYTISIYVVNPSSDINNACMIRLPDNSRVVSWGNSVFAGVSKYSIGFTLNTSTVLGIQLKLFGGATCKIQIEEGSTDTEYEPYKEGNKVLYLNSPLLEGDTIEQYGNNIAHVHRYGKTVFDGSENWNNSDNNYAYVLLNHLGAKASGKLICDKLIPGSSLSGDIFIGTVGLGIHYNDTNRTNLVTLLSWLQSNPTTVVYELASPQYEVISTNDELLTDSYVNGHLDFESAVPVSMVRFSGVPSGVSYLYPSTQYTIQFESDNIGKLYYIGLNYKIYCENENVVKGINKFNILIEDTIVSNFLEFNGIGFNVSNIVVTPAIEQDFDYFSGLSSTFEDGLVTQEMVDSGEEEVGNLGKYRIDYKVTGKNKFDGELVKGYWYNASLINNNNAVANKNNIPVKPNMTYTISIENYADIIYIAELNSQLKETKSFARKSGENITTSASTKYLRFCTNKGILLDINVHIQIEEGSTASTYEPYKKYTKTLYLNSPLLEGDTIEEKNGGIYHVHKYKEVVLDGSDDENWSTMSNWSGYFEDTLGYTRFQLSQSGLYFNLEDTPITIISDKFPSISNINWKTLSEHIENDGKKINIVTTKASAVYEFKSWLQQNPVTAVYKLAEPQYELIEQSNLAIPSYANGHLDFNTAVPISKVNFLHFEEELTYLYANTQYTIQFVSDGEITVDITLGGTELLAQSIVKGLNRITITTPETLADNKLIIDGVGAKISKVVVTNTNREFKYFEGIKSVGDNGIEILSSKNIAPPVRCRYTSNGIEFNFGSKVITENVYVHNISNKRIMTHTSINQKYSRGFYIEKNSKKLIELNEGEVIYCMSVNRSEGWNNSDIQEVMNSFIITKKENELNKQQLTHEPLRAVGESKDKYVFIDGKWYIERNCQQISLTNNMNYAINFEDDTVIVFQFASPVYFKNLTECSTRNKNIIADKRVEVITISPSTTWVKLSKDIAYDVESFKNYLPINLVIPVASPTYEPIDYNPLEVYSDTTHITTNSVIPCNIIVKNHGFNCLLKPSTTYTVSSNLGINTVTTGADIGDSCLRFYNEDISDVTTMKDVLILEGDWTSKADLVPSNFNGIESCFEQALVTDENDVNYGKYKVTARVIGKNLCDITKRLQNKYINNKTYNYSITNHNSYDIIIVSIKTPDKITLSINSSTFSIGRWEDVNGNLIKGVDETYGKINTTLTPPKANCVLKICINKNNINNNIQIEQGNTATEYEPYKESNITFYLDEPLRGTGTAKDKVFIKDDKVIVERNCIVKTVNGSENGWNLAKDNGNNITFRLQNDLFSNAYKDSQCISNLFTRDITGGLIKANNSMRITEYDKKQRLFLVPTKEKCSDLQSFKQWLQQNPTTVVYQLAEPTYEEVEYSSNRLTLDTFNNESFNNSTLFLDTNISPKLSFKPLWEELVYVKNSTKYYIQFNAVGSGEVVINLGGTELTTEIVEGYNCIPITTPSESTNLMTISGQGITISEVVVSEVICGGYYKGLQSCFEEHMENGKYRVLLRGIALDGSKVNGIKLYINEPLRGVGDTKDRLCIKNGKLMVERRCGSITLDGSNDENWGMQNNTNYLLTLAGAKRIYLKESGVGISDKLIVKKSSSTEGVYIYPILQGTVDYIRVANGVNKWSDKASFIQWLQQNPVTLVYPLEIPTYEEVTNEYGLPIVFEGYENGIVYIDSAVTPTTHIKYTSNNQLATTLSEAEEQNITTQEDINMNVITYMMDIDMMLTDMEMSNDISVMAVRRDSSNENMLDRMSEEDKKVYRDNTVVMLEKMITANVLEKEDIEGRINMYYDKNRISKEQYKYLKSLL